MARAGIPLLLPRRPARSTPRDDSTSRGCNIPRAGILDEIPEAASTASELDILTRSLGQGCRCIYPADQVGYGHPVRPSHLLYLPIIGPLFSITAPQHQNYQCALLPPLRVQCAPFLGVRRISFLRLGGK